jgi:predicted membrane-bound spermidine synthase
MLKSPYIPAWKYRLSHFMELHIESAPSEINPHLYVSLKKGRLQLSAAKAVYSFEDLYTNFGIAFERIQLKDTSQQVLILGFGLGSIPIILEQKLGKRYTYTAVEIDENVLYLANKYALPHLQSPIQLICSDALAFVQQCEEEFDMICMDVFLDDFIPEYFQSSDFLQMLSALLAPKGILLYNMLTYLPQDVLATKAFFQNTFLEIFPNGNYIDAKGNWVLLNDKAHLRTKK